ncbi:hypothetical protein PVK06_030460 [Gossypium arboreum]|uniref:Uncharacterized protein n=1 Tax=Gossypium arboreum TaxID=29729 RepID=A0ABR0NND1_GOSAR|nr:hypothetical protein PVK06_030460 [Gossypium arboreum]
MARHNIRSRLDLEEILAIRNGFQYCLLNLSRNGWRQVDANNEANIIGFFLHSSRGLTGRDHPKIFVNVGDHRETFVNVVPVSIAHSINSSLVISPINSPPPPTLVNSDAFEITVAHGPLGGSVKFHASGGVTGTLFP